MAAKRAPIAPILAFQATMLVFLTMAVTGWAWHVNTVQRLEVDLPREALSTARAEAYTAVITPFSYITDDLKRPAEAKMEGEWGPEQDSEQKTIRTEKIQKSNKAKAKADAAVLEVLRLIPDAKEEVNQALYSLEQLEYAYSAVFSSKTVDQANFGASEGLIEARHKTEKAISAIDVLVESAAARHHQTAVQGLLGIWAAMLVVTLSATILARRRAVDIETNERGAIKKGLERASRALTVIEGRDRMPELIDHPDLTSLNTNLQRLADRFHFYMDFRDGIIANENFLADFVEALSVCEREAHIVEAAQRASKQAYKGADFQYLRFDKDAREVVLEVKEQEPVCVLRTHTDCPAGRQGRALHNHSDAGVSRCPLIKAEDKCISCAPIFVNGEVGAIAQIIGYEESTTGFRDFEALALAASARLGVIESGSDIRVQSNTDDLTGLPNNRLVNERLNELDVLDLSYGILVADLDHFRQINDEHGRETGDECLRIFGQVLLRACRDSDMACRIAGETFVVLLPSANVRAGLAVCMRIRRYLVEALNAAEAPSFTVSMGVATKPDHGLGAQSVVRAAHSAMQKAKEAGRDQVIPAIIPEEQDRI
jgi:diguanylate cyclase (GGDEF)-like protein